MIVAAYPVWTRLMPVCSLALAGVTMGACSYNGWNDLDFEASSVVSMDIEPHDALRLEGEVGDMRIAASPDARRITVLAEMVGKGETQAEADMRLKELACTRTSADGQLTLAHAHPEGEDAYPYEVNWSLTVPVGTRIEVLNDVGDVALIDVGAPVDVTTDVGDIWISGATDALVRSDVGDIALQATGAVDAASEVGDVRVATTDLKAKHTVTSDVGDVRVHVAEAWQGGIAASTDVGDLRVTHADGKVVRAEDSLIVGPQDEASPTLSARTDVGDVVVVHTDADARWGEAPELDVPGAEKEPVSVGQQPATEPAPEQAASID